MSEPTHGQPTHDDTPTDPSSEPKTIVWVDHDATPVMIVEILHRVATRRSLPVTFVANRWYDHPKHPCIRSVVVGSDADAADDYIAEHCGEGQVVVTADIPLAARAVEAGAQVIDHRGNTRTKADVREILSLRNFHQELRDAGIETGGPRAYQASDRQAFANALDRWIARNIR